MFHGLSPIARLNAILHRRTHVYYNRELKPYGLSFVHFRMMNFIGSHEGIRQEDIRTYMDADKGGVAHAIKRLDEMGYITRDRDSEDRRAYTIRTTDDGRAFLAEFRDHAVAWSDQMTSGFTAEELDVAERLLQRMVDNVCELLGDECEERARCHK